jgi:lysozyme family protein
MAASNYSACLAKVLKYEGGYVNNPKDPGGETNYGITIATARANGYTGAMRAMPLDVAKSIYKKKYWDVVGGDDLPAGLDLCVFDYAVNSGPSRAKNALAAIGDGTLADRIHRYCGARMAFLHGLKTWGTFGKGWTSRVGDVEATAKKMAVAPVAQAPAPLPVPTSAPSTKQDAKEAGGIVVAGSGFTAALYSIWGNWAFQAALFLVVAAALYWFVARPILRRYWALDDVEGTVVTKLRLALKGMKTKLLAWLVGIVGTATPLIGYLTDTDISSLLPTIKGVSPTMYWPFALTLIAGAFGYLRRFTNTPEGQTDLALAPAIASPSIIPDAPADTATETSPAEDMVAVIKKHRKPRPAGKGKKAKPKKRKARV